MRNAQVQRLTEEQIRLLLDRYRKKKDTRSRDKLVMQYSNLVESVARRFAGAGEPVEDLVQEGYIGLISALEGFDTKKGVKFSTYATHFVIGQIKHYLRDKGKIIKEPAWLQELNQRMTRVIESLSQQHGRTPTEAEISSVMNIPEDDVRDMLTTREVFKVSSLDGEREDGNGASMELEKMKHQKFEVFQLPLEDRVVLETAVDRLKSVEQQVIHEYFFKDLNQTEIARKLGISCNYVSHILRNSTKKLRKILTTEELKEVQTQLRSMQMRGVADPVAMTGAVTDTATDLYNRSYFLARLEEELSRATRHRYPVAVMLLTFEYMSDSRHEWVPLTTDERLYILARNLSGRIRKSDLMARYGDNQFALMLPYTGSAATNVCTRLQKIVADMNRDHEKDLFTLKASLTIAVFPDEAGNIAELLEKMESAEPLATTLHDSDRQHALAAA